MGYTFLYSSDMGGTVQLYHMMPDLVKAVIVDADPTFDCFEDDANCILASTNPDGIPAWKLFSFHFWPSPGHPLGRGWTLAPEDVSGCFCYVFLAPHIYPHEFSTFSTVPQETPTWATA